MRGFVLILVLAAALYLAWVIATANDGTDSSSSTANDFEYLGGAPDANGGLAGEGDMSASAKPSIFDFANAIATVEGRSASNVNHRNSNPGNLRPPNGDSSFWTGQMGVDSRGFAIFGDWATGFQALITNVSTHIRHNPTQTLGSYIASYAPANENDPAAYARTVAGQLGVSVNDTLGSIFGG